MTKSQQAVKSDTTTAIITTIFKTILILLSLGISVLIAHKRITTVLIKIIMANFDIIINVIV
jgi:hypothetical protein